MLDAVDLVATFGELVTYTPYNGTAKQIKALVPRPQSQVGSVGGVSYTTKRLEVQIPIDAVSGIMTVKKGFDTVRCKYQPYDSEETTFTVTSILNSDAGMPLDLSSGGMFHLEVQA